MEAIKVESGVAMPVTVNHTRGVKYPYETMKVGDSFFIPGEGKNMQITVCGRNRRVGKRLGARYTAKKVEGGIRVWRVE